jgi:hypothetical protein
LIQFGYAIVIAATAGAAVQPRLEISSYKKLANRLRLFVVPTRRMMSFRGRDCSFATSIGLRGRVPNSGKKALTSQLAKAKKLLLK